MGKDRKKEGKAKKKRRRRRNEFARVSGLYFRSDEKPELKELAPVFIDTPERRKHNVNRCKEG